MAGGRSRFDRAHVKGYGRLGHPNGSAHLGRPLDGAVKNIFDLQNQVTASVVGPIALKMERAEIECARHTPTEK
jgi:adenylate cyclase